MTQPGPVRARFCPSPTGNPHVGLIRTALFNWAFARHHGGALVFRIEDTDAARDSEASYQALVDALQWLGLGWDEGPDIGGAYGPYRQSQRGGIYTDVARRLAESGEAYESFITQEEIAQRHRAAGRDPKLGYDNSDRDLTADQAEQYRAQGRSPVLRLRMPDGELSWTDLIRGDISFAAGSVADPVLVRNDGAPLYTLTNPVDDAAMRISHVLRGEDLLSSTPRQLALYAALTRIGFASGAPRFAHLPYVAGDGGRKMSKRDAAADMFGYRERGFLPEGLLNYLGLLGWSIAEDRDLFTPAEMVEAFDITRVSANPARFDLRKAEAINAAHLRALAPGDFVARVLPHLQAAGLLAEPPDPESFEALRTIAPLVQQRSVVLSDAVGMLWFLFTDEESFAPEPESAAKALGPDAEPVLRASIDELAGLEHWAAVEIEQALKAAVVDGLGLKPRKAFTPLRVAITGRTVSPPLYESLELLGRQRTLRRLRTGLDAATGSVAG